MQGAGCWERGLPRWPATTATERHKGVRACGYRLTRRALPLRVAAACFVALAASAQAYVWQGRRFRDEAYVLLVENKNHLVPGTRIRAHPHTPMWELILMADNH